MKIDNYQLLRAIGKTLLENEREGGAPFLIITADRNDGDAVVIFSGSGLEEQAFLMKQMETVFKRMKKKELPRPIGEKIMQIILHGALDNVYGKEG